MLEVKGKQFIETSYEVVDEAKISTLFGIGNGYFGIRGSLEEFGDVFIQGTYIRGVFDSIIEIPLAFSTNDYMKKYYFDAQKLKEFEYEDSCINICDFTTMRVYINDKMFLPWEFEVKSWKRYIDFSTGGLVREVLFDDGNGNETILKFVKTCSFDNMHLFFQKLEIEKVNHNLPVRVDMGIDTLVKTNGQHKSKVEKAINEKDRIALLLSFGNKYNMKSGVASKNFVHNAKYLEHKEMNQVYYSSYLAEEKKASFEKLVMVYSTPDFNEECDLVDVAVNELNKLNSYEEVAELSNRQYEIDFNKINITFEGDSELDVILRYANYQTLIGLDRFSSVHSLSAKNLTAEKYNQFVWWDCEILQLPIFLASMPEYTRSILEYRYRCLEEAKKIAANNGYDGAQFAFCSSVKGDENVWIYARHPFLQIHSTADVGYGIINYYRHTLDKEFMVTMGMEMLVEIAKYFISRSVKVNGRIEIHNVTGTDEHHPYINNNAYTNYQVEFVIRKALEYSTLFDYEISFDVKAKMYEFVDLIYLPKLENKMIPQFDGYFDLKPYLPVVGDGAGSFQMKKNGLYHESQIIKQPDVMNVFAYLNLGLKDGYYENWKYYEKMCEASSSLTYPVHGVCAIDNKEFDSFKKYFSESIKIDIDDLHSCAYQGVHAACLAGGWYMVYRGVMGFEAFEDYLVVDPKFGSFMKNIKMNCVYHNVKLNVLMTEEEMVISSDTADINLMIGGKIYKHSEKTTIKNNGKVLTK